MSNAIVGDKSKLPIHARRTKDRTFDRVWKYYYLTNKQVNLSKKEEEIRQRWEFSWMMDCSLLSKFKIAKRLMKKFDISRSQAFEDVKNSRLLFSDPTQQNKAAKIAIMSHVLERTITKAIARDDYKAAEKLILRYDKINGLSVDRENPIADFMKNQKPAAIIFSADPETLKKQADEMVKDVEHEEIDESQA